MCNGKHVELPVVQYLIAFFRNGRGSVRGLKARKNGQQKRVTCFATLLQSALKNGVVRFTIHE